ncbi:hypothetical protein Javan374_0034 [Streptococcus phage Javan374]|uniref:DUF1642 domain-containing protein n=1 Tax=Streptococcus parasanguinis TaxID=1318 RepID=UPI00066E8245|nr:DUF1642 domain-containing protein [Streptococcus parasanguinis]QBX27225.1 hypothetical protein Javan374_0034 [Streptococcus phage Javan374]
MNKQELIEQMKGLKNLFGNKVEYIEIDTAIELASKLDEPQKPAVPQFVADWYEKHKNDFEFAVFNYLYLFDRQDESDFKRWFRDSRTEPFQILVNMHQFGYTVEKEKRYLVKMKGLRENTSYLNYDSIDAEWYFADAENGPAVGTHCTRKELESAGFGWIFSCEGIEVEEVE